jgi:hypothetical protein
MLSFFIFILVLISLFLGGDAVEIGMSKTLPRYTISMLAMVFMVIDIIYFVLLINKAFK